jgi:hypothetical protein
MLLCSEPLDRDAYAATDVKALLLALAGLADPVCTPR